MVFFFDLITKVTLRESVAIPTGSPLTKVTLAPHGGHGYIAIDPPSPQSPLGAINHSQSWVVYYGLDLPHMIPIFFFSKRCFGRLGVHLTEEIVP